MPERSRSSVAATPASVSPAISWPDASIIASGSRRSRACTQRNTATHVEVPRRRREEQRGEERLGPLDPVPASVPATPGRAAEARANAMVVARSKDSHPTTGDQRSWCIHQGRSVVAKGRRGNNAQGGRGARWSP